MISNRGKSWRDTPDHRRSGVPQHNPYLEVGSLCSTRLTVFQVHESQVDPALFRDTDYSAIEERILLWISSGRKP